MTSCKRLITVRKQIDVKHFFVFSKLLRCEHVFCSATIYIYIRPGKFGVNNCQTVRTCQKLLCISYEIINKFGKSNYFGQKRLLKKNAETVEVRKSLA